MMARAFAFWREPGGRAAAIVTVLAFAAPVFFILVPLAIFLGFSFFSVHDGAIDYSLTLTNYWRFFADPVFLPVFWNTCLL